MNKNTLIKFMIGALPVAPVVNDFINEETPEAVSTPDQAYENYDGPTMEEEIAAHSGNIPALKGVENINVKTGEDFDPLAGVYALDNQDGNITDNIEVTNNNVNTSSPGTYSVTYNVENSRGGYYNYVRQITVSEAASDPIAQIPPTQEQLGETEDSNMSESQSDASNSVAFNGVEDLTIQTGESFDPKNGVSVIDVDGTDISNQLYISGEVDSETPGEYTIAYAVFDSFGNPSAEARTVTVE